MTDIPLFAMIEDDPMCRVVVRKQIEGSNVPATIIEFDNGHSALKHILEAISTNAPLPDVIFLDLFMPVMDGWEFLDLITGRIAVLSKVPLIYILTSSDNPEEKTKAEAYELVTGFIVKPIKLRKIEIIMNECLQRRKSIID